MNAPMRPESCQASGDTANALIVRLLRTLDRLDPEQLSALWDAQADDAAGVEQSLIAAGVADEHEIAQAYANHYLVPLFDPPADHPPPIDPRVGRLLPAAWCRDHRVAPLADDGYTLELAISVPDALRLADPVKQLTGRQMRPLFAPRSVIHRLLDALYGPAADTVATAGIDGAPAGGADEPSDFQPPDFRPSDFQPLASDAPVEGGQVSDGGWRTTASPAPLPSGEHPVAEWIHAIFEQALQADASDIHLEPLGDRCRLRLRVGGRLIEADAPPTGLLPAVVARLKALAQLDAGEHHLPQDGVLRLRSSDHRFDVRVSTCPVMQGEKVVMRLREQPAAAPDLRRLGLDGRQRRELIHALHGGGLILINGPAGSGKSTTLYSCLQDLNQPDTNLCTIEDPVEFRLPGVHQLQLRPSLGLTFGRALRTVLRQDPDTVMVGELRDAETAALCLRAVRAGRRLLTAMTTADAPSAIDQLRRWGWDPPALSGALRVLVSQRLIRRLCTSCRQAYRCDASDARRHGVRPDGKLYRAVGCELCRHSGYRGQVAVFEVVPVTGGIQRWLHTGAPRDRWRQVASDAGIQRLRQCLRDKVVQGVTSLEEASLTLAEQRRAPCL